jgi:hypothetical protein
VKDNQDEIVTNSEIIRRLLFEYEQCNEGYNSRDLIAADEFSKLTQIFFVFLTLLLTTNILASIDNFLRVFFVLVIGTLGFISFLSLLLDMEGAVSCKVALRRRAFEIEDLIAQSGSPVLWKTIEERDLRFIEELTLKKREWKKKEKETEGLLFVLGGRLFIFLWIIIVITVLVWGNVISFPQLL